MSFKVYSVAEAGTENFNVRVPARIVSFGRRIITPWKRDIVMPCIVVGNPIPERKWKIGSESIPELDRYEVTTRDEGSLVIRNVQLSDSGNYSCRVENSHGSDIIFYVLLVQGPPTPPQLYVSSTSSNSVTLHWRPSEDGGSLITGYSLSFKRDYGEWEEVQLEGHKRSHVLDNLWCGSRYQLYISAHNNIGTGEPSDISTVKTKGNSPTSPTKELLVIPDTTSVALNLNTWNDGGCEILYFIVEYKTRPSFGWTLVSNNVKPQREPFIIPDLQPATAYSLRITAHNSAGSVSSEYEFLTYYLTEGINALPPNAGQEDEGDVPFYYDLKLIVPISIAIVGLLLIVSTYALCISLRRKAFHESGDSATFSRNEKEGEADPVCEFDKRNAADSRCNYQKQEFNYLIGHPPPPGRPMFNAPCRPGIDDKICPYATYKIPDSTNKTQGHTSTWHQIPVKTLNTQPFEGREKRETSNQRSGSADIDRGSNYRFSMSDYSTPKNSGDIVKDKHCGYYPEHPEITPLNVEPHVPDLLCDAESTSSNDSSPEMEWTIYDTGTLNRRRRHPQHAARVPLQSQYREMSRQFCAAQPSAPTLDDSYHEAGDNITVASKKRLIDIPMHRLSPGGVV